MKRKVNNPATTAADTGGYAACAARSASVSPISLGWLESQCTERLGLPPFASPYRSRLLLTCLKVRTNLVRRASSFGTMK
jgi:hypothetical protein